MLPRWSGTERPLPKPPAGPGHRRIGSGSSNGRSRRNVCLRARLCVANELLVGLIASHGEAPDPDTCILDNDDGSRAE